MYNSIPEILTDAEFDRLNEFNLLNNKAIRDYHIRQEYKAISAKSNFKVEKALDILASKYPGLKKDTLRKIMYTKL